MQMKAKVVLTDYVWASLDVEHEILDGLADLVPLQVTDPEAFFPEAADCDALLNTYGGPIAAETMSGRYISSYPAPTWVSIMHETRARCSAAPLPFST